jgi:hypothetical protein
VLRGSRPGPDFEQYSSVTAYPLRWIHRRLGGTDVYFVANSNAAPVRVGCSFRAPGRRPELWHPDTGVIETPADWHERDGRITVPLRLEGAGSLFVVFREWTEGLDPVQHLWRYDQVDTTSQLSVDLEGKLRLQSAQTGTYAAKTESGKSLAGEIRNLLPPITLGGAWEATFPPGLGAPARYTFSELSSWARQSVPGVKYFSGTATYYKTIGLPPEWFGPDRRFILDLGRVQVIAEVRWNGKDLGVLWKPPFALDVTDWARAGENELEVKVVNLWPNRLIGDEQLPDDCQWRGEGGSGSQALLEWPKWLLEGKPSPTGRITFSTWKHWTKNDPLLESGLLGPVTLRTEGRITLQ